MGILFFSTSLHARDSTSCIRDVVWAEARGESREGQRAVAHVIVNRALQSGKHVCAIISERGQFQQRKSPRTFQVSTGGTDPTGGADLFR